MGKRMPSQAQINHFRTSPAQFMRTHSIKWRGGAPENQAIIDVAMVDLDGNARVRTGSRFLGWGNAKANAPKFELRWAGNVNQPLPAGTFTFQVQWSGYRAGQGRDASLPAAGGPDLMLTPEFTGCTAVCRTNADGSGQFSHYNLMNGANTLDDADMRAIADASYGGGHTTMTKGDARARGKHTEAVCTTVVGFRRNGRWEFWAQFRESKASGEQIRSVEQI
jgi:hypothetical protein